MTPTRWHLLRHAPAAVEKGTVYGRTDVPALPQDPALLKQIAAQLPQSALLVTTPLRRTAETAEMLEKAGWAPGERIVEAGFAEQDFGAWEGTTHAALARENTSDYVHFWDNPAQNRPPGGESFADLMTRASTAFAMLTEAHPARDIVLIGHGGSIRAIVAAILGLSPENALALEIAPLSLSLADHAGTEAARGALSPWKLRGLNLRAGL
ncbi:histidine phosphatase family protein [uncultured Nisaea sp.]|uniref:histidine phosphatase family protein n=1 Tax=uncultured Nisaea sp. TaxID=538215 RepID=UPI0030EBCFB0|tara:strand:+ start:969 stop:1598 length:630 start_codon:yes stop_codon:yes gene_type:complete